MKTKAREKTPTGAHPVGSSALVRRFAKRPGVGWKHVAGSVWEHTTGLRIHLLGITRLPDGHCMPWCFDDQYAALRQQGYNVKRALMVWSLSLIPNYQRQARREKERL